MKPKRLIRHLILTYPSIFPNAGSVLDHLFLVIGNGFKWENGEISFSHPSEESDKIMKNPKKAVVNYIRRNYIDKSSRIDLLKTAFKLGTEKYHFKGLMSEVETILDVKNREKDYSLDSKKIYGLYNSSLICNIPENVSPLWLEEIKKLIKIIKTNENVLDENEKLLFEAVRKRVNIGEL